VPQPEFEVYSGPDAAGRCLERWGEAVVKPAGGSGSRGVSLARSPEELSRAIGRAELAAEGGKVLLERRLAGRELSVETFSAGGRHRVLAVGERIFSPGLFAVASEIRYPAPVGEAERRAVERVAEAVLDALGVDHSPGHIEIMLAPDGPSVVEAGVRGGGFFIFSTIVGAVSGYDIVENWTRLCAGDPVEPVPERPARLGAVLRYLHAGAGVVESVHGLEEARAVPGLLSCGAFVGPGDRVGPIEKDGDRSGWLIASGRDLDEALLRADEAGSRIGFRVRPC
jgi:biotin carboxylase